MMVLNSTTLVTLQFRLSSLSLVPLAVRGLRRKHSERPAYPPNGPTPGVQITDLAKNCDLSDSAFELKMAGYELVDAFHEERGDERRDTHHIVRYVFARCEYVKPLAEEFLGKRVELLTGFLSLSCSAMWNVFAHKNRFFQDGKEVPGQEVLSINLMNRTPYRSPDGQPVMVWQKDADGNRVGNEKVPLSPEKRLRIVESAVQLMTA